MFIFCSCSLTRFSVKTRKYNKIAKRTTRACAISCCFSFAPFFFIFVSSDSVSYNYKTIKLYTYITYIIILVGPACILRGYRFIMFISTRLYYTGYEFRLRHNYCNLYTYNKILNCYEAGVQYLRKNSTREEFVLIGYLNLHRSTVVNR